MGGRECELFSVAGKQLNVKANLGQNDQKRPRDWISGTWCLVYGNIFGKNRKSRRSEQMTLKTFKKQITKKKKRLKTPQPLLWTWKMPAITNYGTRCYQISSSSLSPAP
jgi:hypothetical protein